VKKLEQTELAQHLQIAESNVVCFLGIKGKQGRANKRIGKQHGGFQTPVIWIEYPAL